MKIDTVCMREIEGSKQMSGCKDWGEQGGAGGQGVVCLDIL